MNIGVIDELKEALKAKPEEILIWWREKGASDFSGDAVALYGVQKPRIKGDVIVGKGCAFTLEHVEGFRTAEPIIDK